jgi:hypothetical protein
LGITQAAPGSSEEAAPAGVEGGVLVPAGGVVVPGGFVVAGGVVPVLWDGIVAGGCAALAGGFAGGVTAVFPLGGVMEGVLGGALVFAGGAALGTSGVVTSML